MRNKATDRPTAARTSESSRRDTVRPDRLVPTPRTDGRATTRDDMRRDTVRPDADRVAGNHRAT